MSFFIDQVLTVPSHTHTNIHADTPRTHALTLHRKKTENIFSSNLWVLTHNQSNITG